MNIEQIKITKATIADILKLQHISIQTFAETFAENNTSENLQNYFTEALSIEQLTTEINEPESEFYLAIYNHALIGYFKINFGLAQTDINDKDAMEIERIYVLKEFHGCGAGKWLFDRTIEIAKLNKMLYIWLGVWEKNLRAIAFYKKNEMKAFNKHQFKLGNDLQTDIMMKLVLVTTP